MTLFLLAGYRHLRIIAVTLFVALPLVMSAQAQQGTSTSTPSSAQYAPSAQSTAPSIEHAKLLEQQRTTKLTLATILVTALIGFGTLAYNMRNSNRQAQLQAKLKALDVVISAAGPNSARERLAVVEKILGSELTLDAKPEELDVAGVGAGHDQNRKDLLKLLAEHSDRQLEILELWDVVFGKTALGKNIRALRRHLQGKSQSIMPNEPSRGTPVQTEDAAGPGPQADA